MAKKEEKKKGGGLGKLLLVIIILAIIAALIYFLLGGEGLGLGGSGGEDSSAGGAVERTIPAEEDNGGQGQTVEITVSGESYVVGGETLDLDGVLAKIGSGDKVMITDNEATQDTMKALTDALSEKGVSYGFTAEDSEE